jgi:hypothetical protein
MSKNVGSHTPTTIIDQGGRWALGVFVLSLLALQPTVSHAQEAIGNATSVKPQAEASRRWGAEP